MFASLVGEKGHLAVLIYILLFRSKGEYFFICVVPICISFLVNCLFISFACLPLGCWHFSCWFILALWKFILCHKYCKYLVEVSHLSFYFIYVVLLCRSCKFLPSHIYQFLNGFWIFLPAYQRHSPFQDYVYLNSLIFLVPLRFHFSH